MRYLAVLAYLSWSASFSGLLGLFARGQSCDTLICPNLAPLWGALGAGATWLLNGVLPNAPPANPEAPDTPPLTSPEPDIRIYVEGKPYLLNECDVMASPNFDSQGNSRDNFRACEEVFPRIIWPGSCEDTTRNAITGKILFGMDNRYLTSIDPLCPFEGGVAFWLADLTQQQIDALMEDPLAVRAITPNPHYKFGKVGRTSSFSSQPVVPANQKRSLLKLRSMLTGVEQDSLDPALNFLSTASKKPSTNKQYKYFSQAGGGVRVYMIDTGLDWLDRNFDYTEIEWRYALGSIEGPNDQDSDGHGTCIGSKICGQTFGVAKAASLVVVKTKPILGCFLDALGEVLDDLKELRRSGRETKGKTVIHTSWGWNEQDYPTVARMEELIKAFSEDFQAVVVTSAGADEAKNYGDISIWPALLSEKYAIITAGAVQSEGPEYGARFRWSTGGEFLSVSAPGNGLCSILNDGVETWEAPEFAAAIVSGLVAYFLSIPDLQDYFLTQESLPAAVRDYAMSLSYRRFQAQMSVWNGLDATDPTVDYPDWQFIPFGHPHPLTP